MSKPCDNCPYNKQTKIKSSVKNFLENIHPDYEWIAMDENGDVNLFMSKPYKAKTEFLDNYYCMKFEIGYMFKEDLFGFLNWNDKEPTNIKELLENCEVVDDPIKDKFEFEYDLLKAFESFDGSGARFYNNDVLIALKNDGYFMNFDFVNEATLGEIIKEYERLGCE